MTFHKPSSTNQKRVALVKQKPLIGWREWVSLPQLGIEQIKVKVDTGARTSALHADNIEFYSRGDKKFVKFVVHPLQNSVALELACRAEMIDRRRVKSSTGHSTRRPVIMTMLELNGHRWPIEVTLVNRDVMGYRMLLGRQAMRNKFIVDPGKSFLQGDYAEKNLKR